MLDAAVLILFPVLMAFAAWSDLLTMTISNTVSIVLVAGFVALALLVGLPPGTLVLFHLLPGLGVLALTFALFACNWIGGGDAKLAAAVAVWLGWDNLLDYGVEASLLGAVITLGIIGLRRLRLPAVLLDHAWVARLHARGNGVPYGIALAAAGLLIYPESDVWRLVSLGS